MANTWTSLLDAVYPVGAVYQSWSSTSPATLFGGTWTQITSSFLYAANSAGITGGEQNHTLTVSELAEHSHSYSGGPTNNSYGLTTSMYYEGRVLVDKLSSTQEYSNTQTSGESSPHNNMPPYVTCYIWRRTA